VSRKEGDEAVFSGSDPNKENRNLLHKKKERRKRRHMRKAG